MTAKLLRVGGRLKIVHAKTKAPKKAKAPKEPKMHKAKASKGAPKLGRLAQWKQVWGAMPKAVRGPGDALKIEQASEKARALFGRMTAEEKKLAEAWERNQAAAASSKPSKPKAPAKPKAKAKRAKKAAAPKKPKAPKPKAPAKPKAKRAKKTKAKKAPKKAKASKAPAGEKFPRRYTAGGVLRGLNELGGRATVKDIRHQVERDQIGDAIDDLQRRAVVRIEPASDGNPDHHVLVA